MVFFVFRRKMIKATVERIFLVTLSSIIYILLTSIRFYIQTVDGECQEGGGGTPF